MTTKNENTTDEAGRVIPGVAAGADGSLLAFAREVAIEQLALNCEPNVDWPLARLGADSLDAIEIQLALEYRARHSTSPKYESKDLCAHTLRDLVAWLDEANATREPRGGKATNE